ncbi:MAG TPA: hypothetical protein VK007_11800 [Acidimicrobiales bacterium]|nr:hypothetical protein [Acidimicrobiales bacterium]
MHESPSIRFARTVQALGVAGRELGLEVPAFRSPPRLVGVQRSIRRAPGATLVAVVVRGRPWPAVQADLIEGIIATNDLRAEAADRVRAQLWAAIEPTAVEEEPEGAAPVPPAPAEVRDAA